MHIMEKLRLCFSSGNQIPVSSITLRRDDYEELLAYIRSLVEVKKITVIRDTGTDKVFLDTGLTPGVYPFTEYTKLNTEVARGTAEQWISENFPGIEFNIIDTAQLTLGE